LSQFIRRRAVEHLEKANKKQKGSWSIPSNCLSIICGTEPLGLNRRRTVEVARGFERLCVEVLPSSATEATSVSRFAVPDGASNPFVGAAD
jgi:hypothetical protein